MDRTRNAATYFKSHATSSSERVTSSFQIYSSSNSYDKQNIVANSLKYSSSGSTPSQQNHDAMKSKFLADASLTKPGLINARYAQPFTPQSQRIPPLIPTKPIYPSVQTQKPAPLIRSPITVRLAAQPHKPVASELPPTYVPNTKSSTETNPPSTSFFSRAFSFRSKKQGYALILNHETFKLASKNARIGTHHDVNNLKTTFKKFNIDTHVKNDLTLAQIKLKVQKLQKTDFSKYECFILVILTHGDARHLYAKDTKYEFVDVIEDPVLSTNETLVEKTKIFIINTSREENTTTHQTDAVPIVRRTAVIKRNIFKCNATHFNRPILKGTFFVQSFCKHLQNTGKSHPLYELMMLVIEDVSKDEPPEFPTTESTMTKPFYFQQLLVNEKK